MGSSVRWLVVLGAAAVAASISVGCSDDGAAPPAVTVPATGVSVSGARRLTAYEYDNSVAYLLSDTTRPGAALLPEDVRTPFDNDYTVQSASQVLIEAAEFLATDIAARFVADPARRAAVVPCVPADANDTACLRSFVTTFGRRALRRPLSEDETQQYVDLGSDFASQTGDFFTGVEVVVSAFLQDGDFLYRIEAGTEVEPGIFKLSGYEVATRMSFLVWGSTPDDALLDMAADGSLDTPEQITAAAVSMLGDDRARTQVERFHAMWLGFERLPHASDLTNAMRTETSALLMDVMFDDKRSWLDIFQSRETFIDDTLAQHYGLAPVGSATPIWVDVSADGRRGILSHGSFLSVGNNVADTSPTKRGKFIRERLMCQTIPPPPPDVMADEPPGEDLAECKYDRYEVHRQGTCKACHAQMDGIGFGLENYNREGAFRDHDDGKPQCSITGDGEIVDVGTFNGPAELADLLVDRGLIESCVVDQLYQYAMGHALDNDDRQRAETLVTSFRDNGYRFDELVVALVSDPGFGFRREEAAGDN